MNRQRLSGFSLMEMMVVLLIISIIAAASAPMVNRKMVANAVGGCKWRENGNIIFYNGEGENRAVAIGTNVAPENRPRLHIATVNNHPHIRLTNGVSAANIHYGNTSTLFTTANPTVANSVIIGPGANSLDNNAVAIGVDSDIQAGAVGSITIGPAAVVRNTNNAEVTNYRSIAIGAGATVDGSHSVAIGGDTRAVGTYDGAATFGPGDGATSVGWGAWAVGNNTTAIGSKAGVVNSANYGTALGYDARVNAESGVAIGSIVSSSGGIAIGNGNVTSKLTAPANSINIGHNNTFTASTYEGDNHRSDVIAIGRDLSVKRDTFAMKNPSFAVGSNIIQNYRGISIGADMENAGGISLGYSITSPGGIAIGNTITNNGQSISIGNEVDAKAVNSVAIGKGAKTDNGYYPVAIGPYSETIGNAVALGYGAKAGAANSIAIGAGNYRTAGRGTEYTHAEGTNAIAIGYNAKAQKNIAIAMGYSANASAENAIAIGRRATASGNHSTAIGSGAKTSADNQIVLGTKDTTVYIPGNLVVDKTVVLARKIDKFYYNKGEAVYIGMNVNGKGDGLFGIQKMGNDKTVWAYKGNDHSYVKKDVSNDYPLGVDFTSQESVPNNQSDRRLKNVGEAFKAGLEELKKLELFHYTYKKDESKTPHVGVMAQDLMKIFPDAVWKGEDGFYRIRMEDMFYALVNAVKELDAKIEALKSNEIAELRKENKEMHKLIEALQKQNEKIVEQNEKLEKDNEKILKRINALERKVK